MIYQKANEAWSALGAFRSERERCKRYVFGDQWSDSIEYGGRKISEYQFIMQQGQVPLKNNILRRIIRNVTGVYRSQYKTPRFSKSDFPVSSGRLREINRRCSEVFSANRMQELMPRLLEEFLISGMAVVKLSGEGCGDTQIHKVLPVTADNFFFRSDGYDPRGWDVGLIGEIHHVAFDRLVAGFCRSASDYERIRAIYGDAGGSACKVYEVWHRSVEFMVAVRDDVSASLRVVPAGTLPAPGKEGGIRIADAAGFSQSKWVCSWFAADGTLLKTGSAADCHPYVFKAYPFLDGEVHSYVSDIIDQQRYVNRLITLYDFIMKSSAKGVLLFPDESLPRGMDLQDVAEEWSRFNGVISYRAVPGVPAPTQVSGNATNIGITELLKIELQMLEDISGVSPTLQGKLENANASGTLFARQSEAAVTSLLDVIKSFEAFGEEIARRVAGWSLT